MKIIEIKEKFKARVKKSPGGTTSVFEMTMPNLGQTLEDMTMDEYASPHTESGYSLDVGSDEIRADSFMIQRKNSSNTRNRKSGSRPRV